MNSLPTQPDCGRYLLIDALRGLAVVNMVAYHFLFDVFVIYGRDPGWINRLPAHIWQQWICWTFIFVSGFSWRFGRRHSLRRGIFINVCGVIITAATLIAEPGQAVWFGVLTFLGCAVLLTIPLDTALKNVSGLPGMAVCFVLFLLFKHVQSGYLGLGSLKLIQLPRTLYDIKLLTPLGFPYPGFRSSDYFPLLPWYFLFLCGYFFYTLFEQHEGWKKAFRQNVPILSSIGQKSIWIYMVHQPVCMLLCMLFFS